MDYSDIYNVVAKYYPIGIDKNDPCYRMYSGHELLELKLQEMLNSNEDVNRWKKLVLDFQHNFFEILDANTDSSPLDPSFSVEVLIGEKKIGSIIQRTKICCHLSYLGPFFCMYGKEEVNIERDMEVINFHPLIFATPNSIMEKYYNTLRLSIESRYNGLSLVPFILLSKRIKGLRIASSELKEYQYSSVYQALFKRENITDCKVVGNMLQNKN